MMPGGRNSEPIAAPALVDVEPSPLRWHQKLAAVLIIALCFEIGFFLVVFPWTEYWDHNYFSTLIAGWRRYWTSDYIRGAVSGLGVVNLFVSLIEIGRLRRWARRT